jgi:microsomal epoxide hydrolase
MIKGSFLEFLPIFSSLKEQYSPKDLPYHVIVPSLPGYSFSATPPLNQDFTTKDIAHIMNQLMLNLGFSDGYVAQGGDIGSKIARILAVEYESCKGSFPISSYYPPLTFLRHFSCTYQLLLHAET